MSKMNKTRVVVTGSAGFIGSHLVDKLIKEKYVVYGIDNLSTGNREYVNSKSFFIESDIRNFDELKTILNNIKPEVVFHLAAYARMQPSIDNPTMVQHINATGTMNVLEACRQTGVKKIVFSGSSSVYGDCAIPFMEDRTPAPKNPYALTKLMGEQWCKMYAKLYNMDITILRYFNVYGPRQATEGDYATVIGIFMKQAKEGKKLTIVGDGSMERDFTYVSDVVDANIRASKVRASDVFNVGTGYNHSLKEIATLIQPDTSMHEYGFNRTAEVKNTLAYVGKAYSLLGWEAKVFLKNGLKKTWRAL